MKDAPLMKYSHNFKIYGNIIISSFILPARQKINGIFLQQYQFNLC